MSVVAFGGRLARPQCDIAGVPQNFICATPPAPTPAVSPDPREKHQAPRVPRRLGT